MSVTFSPTQMSNLFAYLKNYSSQTARPHMGFAALASCSWQAVPPLGTYCLLCTGQHGPWAIPAESLKNPPPNQRLQGLLWRDLGSGIFWSSSRESEHRVEFFLLSHQEAAQGNTDVQSPPLAFAQGSKRLLAPPWALGGVLSPTGLGDPRDRTSLSLLPP